MLFIEIGITLSIFMLGVMMAHAIWPCLVHIDWTPFVLTFVSVLLVCMFLHILRWKCWSYLCHNRQRLRSMSKDQRRPLRVLRILWMAFVLWSVAYVLASTLLDCATPWWPGLIIPTLSFIYTLSKWSLSKWSSSRSSSSEPESSNVNILESSV